MTLLEFIVLLIVIGVVLYLINNYLPLDPRIKIIINVMVTIIVIVWLLSAFGIVSHIGKVRF